MHGYALDKLEAFLQPGMKGILREKERNLPILTLYKL
jgi:hypothetical protein